MLGSIARLRGTLLRWYHRHRRDLPWRVPMGSPMGTRPDPYHVLLSEVMLQQTQVATVMPYFRSFIGEFPRIRDLARATEQAVLRRWQGLGYYSRARNLHAAASRILRDFSGEIPRDASSLRQLPGIGRYTAGAVASIAFDVRTPIVDGNIARVLCRLDGIAADPRAAKTREILWHRAREILPRKRVGDFNSAMMELGATICTPRNPKCAVCPIRRLCDAFASGEQKRIPLPRKSKLTPLVKRRTLCIRRRHAGRVQWLIEQRPRAGRWAGLWQFITDAPNGAVIGTKLLRITHSLTHRRYEFDVRLVNEAEDASRWSRRNSTAWTTLEQLDKYPLPRPHVRIADALRELHAR